MMDIQAPEQKHPSDQYTFEEIIEVIETSKSYPFWMVLTNSSSALTKAIQLYRAIRE